MKIRNHILTITFLCGVLVSNLQAQTTAKIKVEQLPKNAQVMLDKKYSKYHINEMVKKEDKQKQPTYEIELQKKNKLIYLVYDVKGILLSTRKSKSFSFDGTEPVKKPAPRANDGHNHTH